jgi:hypothetical protein
MSSGKRNNSATPYENVTQDFSTQTTAHFIALKNRCNVHEADQLENITLKVPR